MKTKGLLEQRTAALTRLQAANSDQQTTAPALEALAAEVRTLDSRINAQKLIDESERREAGTPLHGDAKLSKELRNFSLIKAIAMKAGIDGVDYGFEREVQGELAKRAGKPAEGVLAPIEIFHEYRTVTTALPAGGPGSNLVSTDLMGEMYFDRFRTAMKVQMLGATVLGGQVGNPDIPGLKASATSGWVAENTALSRTDAQYRKVSMTPKHCGVITELSRNMLQQSSPDIEQLTRNDFAMLLAEAVDRAAIAGSGTGAEPRGILNTAGIGDVPMGTNGAAMGIDTPVDIMAKLQYADAPATTRGFLGSQKVMIAAMKLKDGQSLPYGLDTVFQGERREFSTNVPSNLTKGTGTNLSALIYGNWADLLIGYWSAFDLLVNPFETAAFEKGNVSVRAMLTADIQLRYVESFSAAKDIIA